MKSLLMIAMSCTMLQCNNSVSSFISGKHSEPKPLTPTELLFSKFEERDFDTLKVFSGDGILGPFKGTKLDSADVKLFPEIAGPEETTLHGDMYAIFRFAIDDHRTGLVVRTPADYEATSIKLFYFDNEKNCITDYVELADRWLQAADYMSLDAWIYKDSTQKMLAVLREKWGHDNTLDSDEDTTVTEWNYYYLIDLSAPKVDTLSKDNFALAGAYGYLFQ